MLGVVVPLARVPGNPVQSGLLGLQVPETSAQARGRGGAGGWGYRLLCNAVAQVLEPRARRGPRGRRNAEIREIGEDWGR